jgi:hypothetical protein
MIPYADLEFAIARWKARATGAVQPVPPAASGTVVVEMPVSSSPEDSIEEVRESSEN